MMVTLATGQTEKLLLVETRVNEVATERTTLIDWMSHSLDTRAEPLPNTWQVNTWSKIMDLPKVESA